MEKPLTKNAPVPLAPVLITLGVFGATLLTFPLLPNDRNSKRTVAVAPGSDQRELLIGRFDVGVDTLAGGEPGFRDGASWEARFFGPNALALEPDGGLLVCDSRNHRIRRITADRRVETVAGGAVAAGPGGRSLGSAQEAGFRYPSGVARDSDGSIYIADTGNHRVCRLKNGMVSLLAGGTQGHRDGTGAAAAFNAPSALHLDASGNLWVADVGSSRIRRVTRSGATTSPAVVPGQVLLALGDVKPALVRPEISGWSSGGIKLSLLDARVRRRSPGVSLPLPRSKTAVEQTPRPERLELFADPETQVIVAARPPERALVLAGRRTAFAGQPGFRDGTGEDASFALPSAVVWSPSGLYVAEYESHRIRRLTLPEWLLTGQPAVSKPGENSREF